jgi:hypothetical protein
MAENTYSWLTVQYCHLYIAFVINLHYTYTGDCRGHISVCNNMKLLKALQKSKKKLVLVYHICL